LTPLKRYFFVRNENEEMNKKKNKKHERGKVSLKDVALLLRLYYAQVPPDTNKGDDTPPKAKANGA
jgi:hypothetical protein